MYILETKVTSGALYWCDFFLFCLIASYVNMFISTLRYIVKIIRTKTNDITVLKSFTNTNKMINDKTLFYQFVIQ